MTKITIFNSETGESLERDMTEQEVAIYEADQLAAENFIKAKEEAAKAKAALLEKLGITEDEAKLLLS